jgi:hypothetical protein
MAVQMKVLVLEKWEAWLFKVNHESLKDGIL